jgi:hypothetical protein
MFSRRLLLAFCLGTSLVTAAAVTSRAGVVDLTPPDTSGTSTPELNANGWANEDFLVTLIALDEEGGSGVESITYSTTGAQVIAERTVPGDENSFNITAEGQTVVHFSARDNAGNVEPEETLTLRLDKTDPTISASSKPRRIWPPDKRTVTLTISGQVQDSLSGVNLSSGHFTLTDEYGEHNAEGGFLISKDGSFSFTTDVTARRKAKDRNGRSYTFSITAEDLAGNVGVQPLKVIVPHDKRRRGR